MKKKFVLLLIVLLGLSLSLSTAAIAKQKQMDKETACAIVLSKLSHQGLIQVAPGDISTFILVEPLWWKNLTHRKKVVLVNAAMVVARTETKPPLFIIVQDMTSRDTVAKGFVERNEVKIYK